MEAEISTWLGKGSHTSYYSGGVCELLRQGLAMLFNLGLNSLWSQAGLKLMVLLLPQPP